MKPMPHFVREDPCTCDITDNHAAGISRHAIHSDGSIKCHIPSFVLWPQKHLTDAECAAEYWRAKADLATIEAVLVSPAAMNARVRVWHRFATQPNASEVEA